MLCAVLRAIFRPAALVADGCFLTLLAEVTVEFEGVRMWVGACALEVVTSCGVVFLGFICMILRARLGGGGSVDGATSSALALLAPEMVRLCLGLVDKVLPLVDEAGDAPDASVESL